MSISWIIIRHLGILYIEENAYVQTLGMIQQVTGHDSLSPEIIFSFVNKYF